MSGEIQNTRREIQEKVIPAAEKLLATEHHMVGLNRTAANHLRAAREGLREHVLPHLLEAIATKADLVRTGVSMGTQPEDVRKAAHAVLGDIPLYTEIIEPTMAEKRKDMGVATIKVTEPLLTVTEHAIEILKVLDESIGDVSDWAFQRADGMRDNINSTHDVIAALEEFNP